jgi:isocitrate dehydrogenase (NAD+)
MKFTDGLFLNVARGVSSEYAGKIAFEDKIVDNMAMQLVQKPQDYDVMVLPNLYGDIISDLCAGLVGGLGVAPGANIGDDIAIFEAVHGAAPKYKGKNKVNPTAMILSGIMMLKYLKQDLAASKLEGALINVLAEGKYVTYDLKSNRDDPTAVGTQEMADAIIEKLNT